MAVAVVKPVGAGGQFIKQNYDLDLIWLDLKRGVEQIFEGRSMSRYRYLELYTLVFNGFHANNMKNQDISFVLDLYKRLEEFLKSYVVGLYNVSISNPEERRKLIFFFFFRKGPR